MKLNFAKHLILIVLLLISFNSYAQRRKVINYTEIGALIHNSNSIGDLSEINGFRTRTGILRVIQEHYGLGFALGTDNYKRSGGGNYNTLPVSLNGAYFFNSDLSGFKVDAYGGYAVKLFDNLNRGLTAGAGLSYSIAVNKGMDLGIQTGYNYQEIDFPSTFVQKSFNIGTFRLGLGITFK